MRVSATFVPKLFTTLKGYDRATFFSDLLAGVIVGIVALPLAIAFAIASGVSPDKGLITAIVAGLMISLFGGSRVQIGGPTGAFIVIVYGVVKSHGVEGLILATLMAGVMLVAMGLGKLGGVIKFVPRPVVVGFTSGIAVIILSSQVRDFFGLAMDSPPADFIEKWRLYAEHFGSANGYAALLAAGTVLFIVVWSRFTHRIPGSLAAIVIAAAAAHYFALPVETIGSRFGDLPRTLPAPALPAFSFQAMQELIQPAFAIALLAGIESLLSAVVADGMTGGRHRSNIELIAQGLANISSSLFGGIPATGAIARTATNVKSGGRTPVSGIVHALTLMGIVLIAGPWAKMIPLAALAGILVIVSYHMSEWRSFAGLLKGPRSDTAVLLVTFFLTVFFDLVLAIEVGMVLAAFVFIRRMAMATDIRVVTAEIEDSRTQESPRPKLPKEVELYDINGPFFFGISQEFEETMRIVSRKPKVRILNLEDVPFVDATALHALKRFCVTSRRDHVRILLCGVSGQPLQELRRSGLLDELGEGALARDASEAIRMASAITSQPVARF